MTANGMITIGIKYYDYDDYE